MSSQTEEGRNELVYANGIDAITGQYLLPPMTPAAIAALAAGEDADKHRQAEHRKRASAAEDHYGLPFGVALNDVAQAGWAVVFAADAAEEVKNAVGPLIALRKETVPETLVKELVYQGDESKKDWLARHGVGFGSVDPTLVPFYLLIVGCPARIPFRFCHELSAGYAVGLLSFDEPNEYAAYAASVVAAEQAELEPRPRHVTFFGTRHAFDRATQLSADGLVKPLSESELAVKRGCRSELVLGDAATHEALTEVLARTGANAPGLLFTAGHGMGFRPDNADQRVRQGALICQDWGGPNAGPPEPGQYFTADDVPDGANLAGLFAFLFACFGGGTPKLDRFAHKTGEPPKELAVIAFAAALPQRLLAEGALGCIAHVDRAWPCSISSAGKAAGPKLDPFAYAIENVLAGEPIGLALTNFNDRFGELSVALTGMLDDRSDGAIVPDLQIAGLWSERNDAEGYALFGDPAARLRLEERAA